MALIVRIDVDRAYGREPLLRHVMSRVSSDFYFPRVEAFGYLKELEIILRLLNEKRGRAYLFFRQCTVPSATIRRLVEEGQHEIGLHLEDSRSFDSFCAERSKLERQTGRRIVSFSKHGSGSAKYGLRHYAPYEPEKYLDWACKAGMKVFFGNLEDPTISSVRNNGLCAFPSAFWLEPHWRDTNAYPVEWLLKEAKTKDVVLLIHPENVLADAKLTEQFTRLISEVETKIL